MILTESELPHGVFRLEKYWALPDGSPDYARGPYEVLEAVNAYTNAGGVAWLNLLAGAGGTAYNAANAKIGVGDSSAANAVSQTNLQAAVNKLAVAMDATFPSLSGQTMTWQATFGAGSAEWAGGWQEMALFNGALGAGTMLARTVQNWGVKGAGTSWVAQYTVHVP